jgi:beta-galactosidase
LVFGKVTEPVYAGAMHYFRHAPEEWGACLDAMVAMGLRFVDTYVPWSLHEVAPRVFDFGEQKPWLNVRKFVRLAMERGMRVIIRPGPHINAELTCFGIPDRVIWDRACQAFTPGGNPVMLPMIPLAFPVPSYASNAFHEETAIWFQAVGRELSDLRYPDGPIALLQVDNEAALYFRDGVYDQDYHPDAIRLFRVFLESKYKDSEALQQAWQTKDSFDAAQPPVKLDLADGGFAKQMDWVEFQEELLAVAMQRFALSLEDAGLGELPTFHNLPIGEAATPLNSARIGRVLDLVALDYYHRATPDDHAVIARRTTELVTRSEGAEQLAFGAEVGAGFPPFFPPLDESDSVYTLLAACAYGLRGFNLYMAVDRDRWVGAPIDVHGNPRKLADVYRNIVAALNDVNFHTLKRSVPVRLVMPRAIRRLARVTHAFGPVTPAAFNVSGAGYGQSCIEDEFGLGSVATVQAYLRTFEKALDTHGIPYAYAAGEELTESMQDARWIICALAGGVKSAFLSELDALGRSGVRVTVGPELPTRDGGMQPTEARQHFALSLTGSLEEPLDLATATKLVGRYADELGLTAFVLDHPAAKICMHEDAEGVARLVFLMNPTKDAVEVRCNLKDVASLEDLLVRSARPIERDMGLFAVSLAARSVRMFRVKY